MFKKLIFSITLISTFVQAQNTNTTFDTHYSNISEDDKIESFKEVYIKDFKFENPIFDLELKFQPTTNYNAYQSNFWHGNFKKISKYVKYHYSTEKRLEETTVFNEKGLKVSESASGNTNFYFYDAKDRITKWVRVVRNDTLYAKEFLYNNKNQLINYFYSNFKDNKKTNTIETRIAYDAKNRPISLAKVKENGTLEVSRKVFYDGNIVTIETLYNGKTTDKEVIVYSKSFNEIKKVFSNYIQFSVYDTNGQITKQTTFVNNKLSYVRNYQYNTNKDLVLSTYETPADRSKKELRSTVCEYDEKGNKTYQFTSDNISNNTIAYFFEIEY